jgi:hypothetical protein
MPRGHRAPKLQCTVCNASYRSWYRGRNPRCDIHRSAVESVAQLSGPLEGLQLEQPEPGSWRADPYAKAREWTYMGLKYAPAIDALHAATPLTTGAPHESATNGPITVADVDLPSELFAHILCSFSWSELVAIVCRVSHEWLDAACAMARRFPQSSPRSRMRVESEKRWNDPDFPAHEYCELKCSASFDDSQHIKPERKDLEGPFPQLVVRDPTRGLSGCITEKARVVSGVCASPQMLHHIADRAVDSFFEPPSADVAELWEDPLQCHAHRTSLLELASRSFELAAHWLLCHQMRAVAVFCEERVLDGVQKASDGGEEDRKILTFSCLYCSRSAPVGGLALEGSHEPIATPAESKGEMALGDRYEYARHCVTACYTYHT